MKWVLIVTVIAWASVGSGGGGPALTISKIGTFNEKEICDQIGKIYVKDVRISNPAYIQANFICVPQRAEDVK